MKKTLRLFLLALLFYPLVSSTLFASSKWGKRYYMKNISSLCRQDGIGDGGKFAKKYSREEWDEIKKNAQLQEKWKKICPHAAEKIDTMRKKDIKNLFDFVWKYASDGELPSCSGL